MSFRLGWVKSLAGLSRVDAGRLCHAGAILGNAGLDRQGRADARSGTAATRRASRCAPTAGTLVVLDCGTGAHGLGPGPAGGGRATPVDGHLLIGHTHWDHIQGLPFFAPLFVPGNEWDIYAPARARPSRCARRSPGRCSTPTSRSRSSSSARRSEYHDLVEGDVRDRRRRRRDAVPQPPGADARVPARGRRRRRWCTPPTTSRTRRELGAAATARSIGQDVRHVDFLAGADLVIHDAQYRPRSTRPRSGWGHSTVGVRGRRRPLAPASRGWRCPTTTRCADRRRGGRGSWRARAGRCRTGVGG